MTIFDVLTMVGRLCLFLFGTTVTAWILSLTGISSSNIFIKLLKPMSFTPVLALIGVVLYMFCKNNKKKDTGTIETGFVWSDILTNLERTSDHCSNIAACVIDAEHKNLNLHESLRTMKKESSYFKEQYKVYAKKYLPEKSL